MLINIKNTGFLLLYVLAMVFVIVGAIRLFLSVFPNLSQAAETTIIAIIVLVIVGLFTELARKLGLFKKYLT